jgi:hypothetical protein
MKPWHRVSADSWTSYGQLWTTLKISCPGLNPYRQRLSREHGQHGQLFLHLLPFPNSQGVNIIVHLVHKVWKRWTDKPLGMDDFKKILSISCPYLSIKRARAAVSQTSPCPEMMLLSGLSGPSSLIPNYIKPFNEEVKRLFFWLNSHI